MKTLARMVAICLALGASALPGAAADPDLVNLPGGTLVQLRITDPVSTREARAGDTVSMRVSEDVYLGTRLLIRKGETTSATISEVRSPRNWGRSGRIGFELGAVKAVDGTQVALGPWSRQKDGQQSMGYAAGATVGGAALLGPVGLVGGMFIKGKHVDIPAGQEFKAAVRWDVAVNTGTHAPAAATLPVVVVPATSDAKPAAAPTAPAKADAAKSPVAAPPAKPAARPEAKPEVKPEAKPVTKKEPEKIAPVIPIIEDITGGEPAKKN